MTIQDAMEEAIYKDVLARPGRYPPELVERANDYRKLGIIHRPFSHMWAEYRKTLAKYADRLPETDP